VALRAVVASLACLVLATGAPASAAGPVALLPDLRMARMRQWHLVREHSGPLSGHRLLRFMTIIANAGHGPLDIVGQRPCSSVSACPTMTTVQRIRLADGSWASRPSTAKQKYEVGDHHHHWHVIGMERMELFSLDAPPGPPGAPLAAGAKFGYCFFDERPWRLGLPGAPGRPRYVEEPVRGDPGCATPSSLRTHVGLSVGWADAYPWNFAGQWIDTTGLPDGAYLVCSTVDPEDRFTEERENNNQAWTRIQITGMRLRVVDDGRGACARQLPGGSS
jgi:hypothetical protein